MALDVNGLTVYADLREGTQRVVSSLSFSVFEGEKLAVVGESGCGKTMTALALMGLLPSNCRAVGSAVLDGEELIGMPERRLNALRGRKICLIPQSGAEFLDPSMKISSQLGEALARQGIPRADRRAAACERMRKAGLDDPARFLDRYPFELSGGQAQKVVLAAAQSGEVRLLIADEPTKGIDRAGADAFLDGTDILFPGAAVIMITHDIAAAAKTDMTLVMLRGVAVEYGRTRDVLSSPAHPYTAALIASLPERGLHAPETLRDAASSGCPLYAECPLAKNACRECLPAPTERHDRMTRCPLC